MLPYIQFRCRAYTYWCRQYINCAWREIEISQITIFDGPTLSAAFACLVHVVTTLNKTVNGVKMDLIASAYESSDDDENREGSQHLVAVGNDHLERYLHTQEQLASITLARRYRRIKSDLCTLQPTPHHDMTYSRKRSCDGSKIQCVQNRWVDIFWYLELARPNLKDSRGGLYLKLDNPWIKSRNKGCSFRTR